MLKATIITQTNNLNYLAKSYDANIKIVGLQYNIRDAKTLDEKMRLEWRSSVLRRALINTKILKEDELFEKGADGKPVLRGVVSNAHPLGGKNNSAIVVAFNVATLAHKIKEAVRRGSGLEMMKEGKEIKINAHLPPILDALHNEALRARRAMIEKAKIDKKPRKIHCNIDLTDPWIHLIEVVDGVRQPLPFTIEDGRLLDPARSMAVIALNDIKNKRFTPYRFLSKEEKDAIPTNILRAATPLSARVEDDNKME